MARPASRDGWGRQMGRVIRRGRPTKRVDDNGSSAVNRPELSVFGPPKPEYPPPRSEFRQMGWSDIDVNPEQLDPSGLVACREGRPGWTKRHSLSAVGSGGFVPSATRDITPAVQSAIRAAVTVAVIGHGIRRVGLLQSGALFVVASFGFFRLPG